MTSAWGKSSLLKPAKTNTPPTSTRNSTATQGSVQRCPHLRRCTRRLLAWTLDTVQLLANKAHEFVLWSDPDDTLFIDEQRRCTVHLQLLAIGSIGCHESLHTTTLNAALERCRIEAQIVGKITQALQRCGETVP